MLVLVTGAAGFIGSTLSTALLDRGDQVVGVDNLNDYYDVALKEARLRRLRAQPNFSFVLLDVGSREKMAKLFAAQRFDVVERRDGRERRKPGGPGELLPSPTLQVGRNQQRMARLELQLFGERAHTILLTADQLKTAHTEGERLLDERTRVGKAA